MAVFEDLLKKAEKRTRNVPDYELELEGEKYSIQYPDALQMLEFSKLGEEEMLSQLRIIFSKNPSAWNALIRELDGQDAAVLQVVVEDMFNHWNKYGANPGKSSKQGNSEK